ncbi:MAG TPA: glycoside hydrolase family 2 TIM barrel-domain containing protein, partial [Microthrixaceae bacterium]|nr:glycoside hydrolase family 2 TIM barrel-domain containing protein [Microthrixaceae bacterium]
MWRDSVLDQALIEDPTVTALNRLAMRGSGRFTNSVDSGRVAGPASSVDERADDWSVSLDGTWDFRLLGRPEGVTAEVIGGAIPKSAAKRSSKSGPSKSGPSKSGDEAWSKIEVPGAWTLQGPDVSGDGNRAFEPPQYTNVIMPFLEDPPNFPRVNPTGVYRRTISIPRSWKGSRVILRIGAAESVVQVFVNGELIGGGTDSRLPSEFDLSAAVTAGRRAELAVVVTKWSAQTWLEDQDQWWHGGIQRSVTLHSVPQSSFTQVKLIPGLKSVTGSDRFDGSLLVDVRAEGPVVRERGWTIETSVETIAKPGGKPRTLAATGRLDVPIWEDADEVSSLLSGTFVEPGVVRADLQVPGISRWSHEDPKLYRTLTVLRDPAGGVVQVHSSLTGFRSVEIAGNELLINGKPILLHGVNIHEHSPDRGRAVTAEQTRDDLVMMKAHNMNAVRAAHYPHDEHLAELCDELGLYLIDEANIESHSRQASLCHDTRYTHSIIERVKRMVERDQHHPSIIIWSLGNEAGYGAAHDAAAALVRRYDPSRPIQYEGPFMHDLYAEAPVSDVVCPMYTSIDEIVAWAKSGRDDKRPLILCEYSHAMGNSNGSLSDYWEAFETTPGLQGGFIWEWVDHGLKLYDEDGVLRRGPLGNPSWGYGGDFGDSPNDTNFVCDGLVSADRVAGPAMAEVRHVGRPVVTRLTDPKGSARPKLSIENRRWFTDTTDLRARWELTSDGDVIDSGELKLAAIAPRSQALVALPFSKSTLAKRNPAKSEQNGEIFLTVTFSLRRGNDWARAGYVLASDQLQISSGAAASPSVNGSDVFVGSGALLGPELLGPELLGSESPESDGSLPVLDVAGITWRPTIFRALTDNDGIHQGWMRGLVGNLARWV